MAHLITPRRGVRVRSFRRAALGLAVLAAASRAAAAQWLPQQSGTTASLRGLAVVDDSVVWASGTHGTYLWTHDAGAHWTVGTVPGAASLDFRDVAAVSRDTAWLMASAQDTARIYRTTDRGAHWALQYDDVHHGVFLDAIAFFDARRGLALGDPIGGHFLVLRTQDAGEHWAAVPEAGIPPALAGEAAFAASGTALVTCGPHTAWFGTGGGSEGRVLITHDGGATWTAHVTPVHAGDAAGIFSLACRDSLHGVAVGGNYAHPDSGRVTAAYTDDGGRRWLPVAPGPATAYLSGVAYLAGGPSLLAVGTGGTAASRDWGRTWVREDTRPLNAIAAAPTGNVWAVGPHGTVLMRPGAAVVASP